MNITFIGSWNKIVFIFCKNLIPLAYLLVVKLRHKNNNKSPFRRFLYIDCQGYETDALLRDTFFKSTFYLYKSCSIGLKFASIINKGQMFNPMQFSYEFYFILTLKSLAMGRLGGQKHETIR